MNDNDQSEDSYKVLINGEEQYSLWSAFNPIPKGWSEVKSGTKEECLAFVREVWTDMRPLSLRKKMDAVTANS
jgi:MbtH protein